MIQKNTLEILTQKTECNFILLKKMTLLQLIMNSPFYRVGSAILAEQLLTTACCSARHTGALHCTTLAPCTALSIHSSWVHSRHWILSKWAVKQPQKVTVTCCLCVVLSVLSPTAPGCAVLQTHVPCARVCAFGCRRSSMWCSLCVLGFAIILVANRIVNPT